MKNDAQFYVVQKALIRKEDQILVLNDPIERLDYPGGKIQEGETNLKESLRREVREETGLEIDVGIPFTTCINTFPPQHKLAGKLTFLVAYICEYVSGEVKLSEEHNGFLWVNKKNYKKVDDDTSYFEILEIYFNR